MNNETSGPEQLEHIRERLDSCRFKIREYNNKLKEAETEEERYRLRGRIAGVKAAENRWKEILGSLSEEKESFSNPKRRRLQ